VAILGEGGFEFFEKKHIWQYSIKITNKSNTMPRRTSSEAGAEL
jgi:hypothetical protein